MHSTLKPCSKQRPLPVPLSPPKEELDANAWELAVSGVKEGFGPLVQSAVTPADQTEWLASVTQPGPCWFFSDSLQVEVEKSSYDEDLLLA